MIEITCSEPMIGLSMVEKGMKRSEDKIKVFRERGREAIKFQVKIGDRMTRLS